MKESTIILYLALTVVMLISGAKAQIPTSIDVYNTEAYADENGAALEPGDVVQLLWAGPDGQIDPPVKDIGGVNNGKPTDDDIILVTSYINQNSPARGTFYINVSTYDSPEKGHPAVDDWIYVRAFNDNDLVTATFYGDAQLHRVQLGSTPPDQYDALIGQTDQALPVELISFEAFPTNQKVELRWKTASEVNNLGFKITRSLNEGGDYQLISSYETNEDLHGAGNSNEENSYSYVDESVLNGETYWYKLIDVDVNGVEFENPPISTTLEEISVPKDFVLKQNYPNPFNPETKIEFGVPEGSENLRIRIEVYDILGKRVRSLTDKEYEPGYHSLIWDGRSDSNQELATGVYFLRLQNKSFVMTRKMLLMR